MKSIFFSLQLHAKFDDMKISVSEEKKRVEEQRRILEENIADFQVGSASQLGFVGLRNLQGWAVSSILLKYRQYSKILLFSV